ncbi:protein SOSEKI 1 isoform X2 [Rhododendron vialii]|nr:protein SOSEKI 1 isoform X2 [Rhododendron vialii]
MEAQCGGGGGSGEMRKIHIIYFLSRKGRTEHPHLIKVHHLSRNGVRLRDVKRWLSELRGKDMPESFAWSYKRRYKTGYLWQDLLDEDLITPISDNEYVLKGSEIPSLDLYLRSPSKSRASSFQEDEVQEHRKSTMEAPKNSTCEIEEESPTFGSEASTVTDDSTKLEEEKNISGENKPETPRKSDKIDNSSSFYSSLLNKNNSKKTKKNDASNPTSAPAPPPPTPRSSQFTKSKSYSANVFRNLLSCGAVDANETAMVTINRREKNSCHIIPPKKPADVENIAGYGNAARICRGDKLGGSERVFRTSWHHEQKPHPDARKSCDGGRSSSNSTKGEFNNLKPVSAAYKPINGPNCAQCGKMFKPEKLHKHMKSCRGMKSLAKGATSASVLETRRSSVDSACQESVSGYFLTDGSEFQ